MQGFLSFLLLTVSSASRSVVTAFTLQQTHQSRQCQSEMRHDHASSSIPPPSICSRSQRTGPSIHHQLSSTVGDEQDDLLNGILGNGLDELISTTTNEADGSSADASTGEDDIPSLDDLLSGITGNAQDDLLSGILGDTNGSPPPAVAAVSSDDKDIDDDLSLDSIDELVAKAIPATGSKDDTASSSSSSPNSISTKPPSSSALGNQAKYGNDGMEYPSSFVKCSKCRSVYAIKPEDLGSGNGKRLECSVCGHSWFQSKDRVGYLENGFSFIPLPEHEKDRVAYNLANNKNPMYMGDMKLYIGNVPFEASEMDLLEIFQEVGPVGDVALIRDPQQNNRPRGFGFITMRTKADGMKAIDELNGMEVYGRNLVVKQST